MDATSGSRLVAFVMRNF